MQTLSISLLCSGELIPYQPELMKLDFSECMGMGVWLPGIPSFDSRSYTIVENFSTYWVQATSEAVPVVPTAITTTPTQPVTTETTPTTVELPDNKRAIPLKEAGVADILVRLHGEP
jgi:hypothetical protein